MVRLAVAPLVALLASGVSSSSAGALDSLEVAADLLHRSRAASRSGDFAAALSLAEQGLGIRERSGRAGDRSIAEMRIQLAHATGELGRYGQALTLYREAWSAIGDPAIRDSALVADLLNGMGRLHVLTGQRADGRAELERSLAIRRRLYGLDAPPTRITLNNLASAYAMDGDLSRAREAFRALLESQERQTPIDSAGVATTLNNLANVIGDLGDLAEARALLDRALAIRRARFGPRHPRVGIVLHNLAATAEAERRPDLALDYQTEALEVFRSSWPDHPLRGQIQVDRAATLARLGAWREALEDALEGERVLREHLRLTFRSLSEEAGLEYERRRASGLHAAIRALHRAGDGADSAASRAGRTLDAVIRSRGLLLDEAMRRRRAVAETSDSTRSRLAEAWRSARDALARLHSRSLARAADDSAFGNRLAVARRNAELAEERLAASSAGDPLGPGLGLSEVLASLPPGAVLVSYVRHAPDGDAGDSARYEAFVARRHGGVRPVDLGPAVEVERRVQDWRRALARDASGRLPALAEYRRVASRLRRTVWDPLAPAIGRHRLVFLVPDAVLGQVAWHALPADAGRFLLDAGPTFHELSCERDLVRTRADAGLRGTLLAMGGVDYEPAAPAAQAAPAPDRGGERARFAPLPQTRREIEEVSALWRGAARGGRVLDRLGATASEPEFKRLAPRSEAIHLATHVYGVERPEGFTAAAAGAGVALAGANRPPVENADDGLLSCEEIATLDLSRARSVVVSACGSGLGPTMTAEGTFGLRRAFQVAGAGTLILSLWDVGDAATRRWMREFYARRLRRGLPAAAAAREASLTMLRELRRRAGSTHPATWGAFVASGEWR